MCYMPTVTGNPTTCSALLVFHRKDLCEARVNSEVSSYFQMTCPLRQAVPPGADILWPRAQLGHIFR